MEYLRKFFAATFLFAALSVSSIVNAALVERLGGLAYYDTDADLTWLQDANAGGIFDWVDANNWATDLTVGGASSWRLATTLQPDYSCSVQDSFGSNGYNCTGSEMGNLFYNVLGGSQGASITTTHNANYYLFSNIQDGGHWSSTESSSVTHVAWVFGMQDGNQYDNSKANSLGAWAVADGDIGAVPIPPSVFLFTSGLLALVGFNRRKHS